MERSSDDISRFNNMIKSMYVVGMRIFFAPPLLMEFKYELALLLYDIAERKMESGQIMSL